MIKCLFNNKYLLLIASGLFIVLTSFTYYLYTTNKIEKLELENLNLTKTVEQKEKYIQNLKFDYDKILKSKDELFNTVNKSNKLISNLRVQLERKQAGKKSIEDLAYAKPTLVEGYINKRIKAQLNCFKYIDLNGECK